MTTQHTPGPWKHNKEWGLIKYGKTEICALHSGNPANARLIAAAPDLLSALKWAVEQIEDDLDLDHIAALEGCRAAIAKAEGME